MVIGGPGSGKTWLAARLAQKTALPLFSVDDVLRQETGAMQAPEDIDRTVSAWASGENWIIEGGNSRTYALRASRATLILRLRPPLWLRFIRVLRRSGPTLPLLRWTLKYDRIFGPKEDEALRGAAPATRILLLKRRRDIRRFLDAFPPTDAGLVREKAYSDQSS